MVTYDEKMQVLREIQRTRLPVGASYLCTVIDLSQAAIGRILQECEQEGLLEKVSNKGRVLTGEGLSYMEKAELRESKMQSADRLISLVEDADRQQLLEILEVRMLLEPKAAANACRNGSDQSIRELDNILYEYIYALNHGRSGSDQDFRLHMTIAKMSGNTSIYRILKLILTSGDSNIKYAQVSNALEYNPIQMHTGIVDAIKKRDAAKAAEAMLAHLTQLFELI